MGGMVVILARFKDNSKMSFRTSTGCLTSFHDLRMLDENYFKDHVVKEELYIEDAVADYEQEDYYNARCFFAPYDYGLLFFDFKEKQVWSSNNYNGFFLLSSWLIRSQYETLAQILSRGKQTTETLSISEGSFVDGETVIVRKYHFLEDYSQNFSSLFYIQQVLDRKGTFIYKDKPLPAELTDIYSILAYINGEDYLTPDALKKGPPEREWKTLRSDMCDTVAVIPEWTVHDGDGNSRYIQLVFDYVQSQNLLTAKDLQYWSVYLTEQKAHEKEYPDEYE
jgi:hypothetical protein